MFQVRLSFGDRRGSSSSFALSEIPLAPIPLPMPLLPNANLLDRNPDTTEFCFGGKRQDILGSRVEGGQTTHFVSGGTKLKFFWVALSLRI